VLPDSETIRNAARTAVSELTGKTVKDSQKLVSLGLIDSLGVLKLISLLEKKLHIVIPPETLQPEDFDDVALIVETIGRVGEAGK
jgi:acyl carrier protein